MRKRIFLRNSGIVRIAQSLVEYLLITAVLCVVAIGVVRYFSEKTEIVINKMAGK